MACLHGEGGEGFKGGEGRASRGGGRGGCTEKTSCVETTGRREGKEQKAYPHEEKAIRGEAEGGGIDSWLRGTK